MNDLMNKRKFLFLCVVWISVKTYFPWRLCRSFLSKTQSRDFLSGLEFLFLPLFLYEMKSHCYSTQLFLHNFNPNEYLLFSNEVRTCFLLSIPSSNAFGNTWDSPPVNKHRYILLDKNAFIKILSLKLRPIKKF